MLKSKKYFYTGDQIWNDDSDVEINSLTLANDIIADSELSSSIITGCLCRK